MKQSGPFKHRRFPKDTILMSESIENSSIQRPETLEYYDNGQQKYCSDLT